MGQREGAGKLQAKGIVVHHSADLDSDLLDYERIREFHTRKRRWRDIGYHAVIERVNGEYVAIIGRPFHEDGAHCVGRNEETLGVCFVGNYESAPPPKAQLEVGARLIAGLCHLAKIPVEAVKPHRDFAATACPGKNFPMDELRRAVRRHLAQ